MAVVGFIIFIIVLIVVIVLISGGINHEVSNYKQIQDEKNDVFIRLENDFVNNKKIDEFGYALSLGRIISNVSIYIANVDKNEILNKAEWEQTIFSLCFLSAQMKKPKDARDFYEKFLHYRDFDLHPVTNILYFESRKIQLKGLLNDILFFEKWIK